MQRARTELKRENGDDSPVERRLLNLLDDLGGERRYTRRIVVKSSGRIHFVKVDEIDWVEAEGNYVRLHIGASSHLLRETMKGMEAALDPDRFIRIHRSTIVNTERIKELQPLFHGEYAVLLYDGTRLVASRGPENRLRKMLDAAHGEVAHRFPKAGINSQLPTPNLQRDPVCCGFRGLGVGNWELGVDRVLLLRNPQRCCRIDA